MLPKVQIIKVLGNLTLSIIVGGQYGDEGKGKITSWFAKNTKLDAVVRAGTGPNAGHTVVVDGTVFKLRIIPSGFFADAKIYIGAGMLVTEKIFHEEVELTNIKDRIFLDHNTGVITEEHVASERADNHLMKNIGSTGSGCGTANVDRIRRKLKVAHEYESLVPYITNVSHELNAILDRGGNILIEGSQATFLSLYHGNYPYTTSKDVSAAGALSDVGIGPTRVDEVILVLKSFVTRVGAGELNGEISEDEVRANGWEEFGTVTGRLRRAAPFDYDLARRAVSINGATKIALTKVDILYPDVSGKTDQNDLTPDALEFIKSIEEATKVPVRYISTGPAANELIVRKTN